METVYEDYFCFSNMIQFMPVPEDVRFNFHLKVFENCQPIFGDKTVIMLMLIYVVFDLEDNWHIRYTNS